MKVIVAGSRGIFNESAVVEVLNKSPYPISEVVSGHAMGVDQMGEAWAKSKGIRSSTFLPKYISGNGKVAPLLRNIKMAEYADALIAIWDGKSTGTQHMIDQMKKLGKPYSVYICNADGTISLSSSW